MGTCVNRYVRATVMHLHLKIKAREFVGQFANGITNFCLYSNDCTTRENGHGSNGTQDAAIVKVLVACAYSVLSLGFFLLCCSVVCSHVLLEISFAKQQRDTFCLHPNFKHARNIKMCVNMCDCGCVHGTNWNIQCQNPLKVWRMEGGKQVVKYLSIERNNLYVWFACWKCAK